MSVKPKPIPARHAPPAQSQTTATSVAARKAPDPAKLEELTSRIAYELYEKRGRADGHALEDWLAAEKLAKAKLG